MKRPSQLFTTEDRRQVSQAVAEAEARTAAEIVPAIAKASGRYDRAEDLIGLWTAAVAVSLVWLVWPEELPELGSWSEPWPAIQLAGLLAALLVGFFGGALVGSRVGWLRRLFVSRRQMQDEVWQQAVRVFHDRRISRTAGRSGVLIYISLFERMAAVVGDQAVLTKIGQASVDDLCRQLTTRLANDPPIAALCDTIALTGEALSANLPRATDDVNELGDALVLLD